MAVRRGKRAGRSEGFSTAKKAKGGKVKRNPPRETTTLAARPRTGTRPVVPRIGKQIVMSAACFPPPDADVEHVGRLPLGPDELDKLRALLRQRQRAAQKLLNRVNAAESEIEEDRRTSADLTDRGADRAMEMLLLREQAKEIAEIEELEAALGRMRKGKYGICTSCDERISYRRLLALPEARRCIRCENDGRR
ncbi:MAG: TraR/DksA family transcriptional regulator [Deltaproteobacteria bacterium]|nr:TraR/DksA family transcriptional regulator [Deltaproteobacteria bacterium]